MSSLAVYHRLIISSSIGVLRSQNFSCRLAASTMECAIEGEVVVHL